MCGITGIISKNNNNYEEQINNMMKSIIYRGPDEQRFEKVDNCTFGHVRLSIIDLKSGQQPMFSRDSDKMIVFNGEIYGYKQIKENLYDYPFKTESDTEVILALYEKYGVNMLKYLPGAFSFVIWDSNKKTVFAARDRLGEKPFYYAFGENGEFIFASEIKAILSSNLITPKLDVQSLLHSLKYKYVHPTKTIYDNIYTLPPAHYLKFNMEYIKIERYWNLSVINENISKKDALSEFKYLFEKSVKKMMVSDVPVGAFLSGGLDSSSIVAEAVKHCPKLTTISFGYTGKSELEYAKEVSKMYGTEHIEIMDNQDNLAELFVDINKLQDEPFVDMAEFGTYLISKHASKYLKVILSGDGADELLGGYVYNYIDIYKLDKYSKCRILFDYYYSKILSSKENVKRNKNLIELKTHIKNKELSFFDIQKNKSTIITDEKLKKICICPYINPDVDQDYILTNTADDALRFDLYNYLPGDILVKSDRMTMLNSLECRLPFLDIELVEFLTSLPIEYKMNNNIGKTLLRDAYEQKWPNKLKKRPKQGFWVNDKAWLARKDFRDLYSSYLDNNNSKIFSYFDKSEIKIKSNFETWFYLTLAVWMEQNRFI